MSDTRARASLLARWVGSFERKGLRGRLVPASVAGKLEGGVPGGRLGVAGREPPGTNGGADGGVKGDEDGGGMNAGTGGGGLNSGTPDAGEGGVAVAAGEECSTDSGLARGAEATSASLGGGAEGRCACGAAVVR